MSNAVLTARVQSSIARLEGQLLVLFVSNAQVVHIRWEGGWSFFFSGNGGHRRSESTISTLFWLQSSESTQWRTVRNPIFTRMLRDMTLECRERGVCKKVDKCGHRRSDSTSSWFFYTRWSKKSHDKKIMTKLSLECKGGAGIDEKRENVATGVMTGCV